MDYLTYYIVLGWITVFFVLWLFKIPQMFYYDLMLNYYYGKYHSSFLENVNEAQSKQHLPDVTIKYKAKYHAMYDRLIIIDPDTIWKRLV